MKLNISDFSITPCWCEDTKSFFWIVRGATISIENLIRNRMFNRGVYQTQRQAIDDIEDLIKRNS